MNMEAKIPIHAIYLENWKPREIHDVVQSQSKDLRTRADDIGPIWRATSSRPERACVSV